MTESVQTTEQYQVVFAHHNSPDQDANKDLTVARIHVSMDLCALTILLVAIAVLVLHFHVLMYQQHLHQLLELQL